MKDSRLYKLTDVFNDEDKEKFCSDETVLVLFTKNEAFSPLPVSYIFPSVLSFNQ